jgi:Tol biopolymer transport system component
MVAAAAMMLLVPSALASRGASDEIVFVRGTPSMIWMTRADGTHQRLVTAAGSPGSPTWSRDHRWIAFVWADDLRRPVSAEIWVTRPDGSGARPVTNMYPDQADFPSFSPDGRRLAFDRIGAGIWVVNVDGSSARALTREAGFDDYQPAWSPDGARIAFVRQANAPGAIYVMSATGAGAHRLVAPPRRSDNDERPSWSPDGKWIVFERHLNLTPLGADGFIGTTQLWIVGSDGQHAHLLLPNAGAPAWSPDGNWIVFSSHRSGHRSGLPSLYKVHPDGTGLRRVTDDPRGDADPAW